MSKSYRFCASNHELIKLTACEPMNYYGNWLGSTGLYENLDLEMDWDCDSLTADVQFELVEVDTAVIRQGDSLIATASNATFQWIRCAPGWPAVAGATGAGFRPDTAVARLDGSGFEGIRRWVGAVSVADSGRGGGGDAENGVGVG